MIPSITQLIVLLILILVFAAVVFGGIYLLITLFRVNRPMAQKGKSK